MARVKAGLGLMEEINAKTLKENFPSDGFREDLSILPFISFGTIWRYMIEEIDAKKQLSTAKPLVKEYNFFKSGHVLTIKCRECDGQFYVKSKVLPSMKKSVVYKCYIVLDRGGKVMIAYDGCPAGIDGRCNHVTSTLFALEEFFKQSKEFNNRSPSLQPSLSCTSKPCAWNIPRKRKVKTSQLLVSSSESTNMEKLPNKKTDLHCQLEIFEHRLKGTHGLILIFAICCTVSEKLKTRKRKKWL